MSCATAKFVISKGVDNTFTFTIKQDNSTLPLAIEVGDTFVADLVLLDGDVPYGPVTNTALSVDDALNGKVSLFISAANTATLVSDKASKVDRYYLRPTYKLVLKCITANNGNFVAKVPEVHVD